MYFAGFFLVQGTRHERGGEHIRSGFCELVPRIRVPEPARRCEISYASLTTNLDLQYNSYVNHGKVRGDAHVE